MNTLVASRKQDQFSEKAGRRVLAFCVVLSNMSLWSKCSNDGGQGSHVHSINTDSNRARL